MNKALIGGIAALVVIIGAGVYVSNQKAHDAMMMAEQQAQKAQEAAQKEKMVAEEAVKAEQMKKDEMMKADAMKAEDPAMKKDTMVKDDATMMHKGSYVAYTADKLALAATGQVVLFFRAGWCPTCRAVDADIKAHLGAIPEKLTILDVDYDASTDLKTKYGVTYQHTFVQVDAKGNLIKKWSGSPTLAALVAEVK